ncbi:MAG: VOC family protein [Ignavibacteria bacterium]|nr:VOC family protein [Ignavibacteria bacterium]
MGTEITSIKMGSIYVDNFGKAMEFYKDLLGLKGEPGENSCFFPISPKQAIYVEGKYKPVKSDSGSVRSAITFEVASTGEMLNKLRSADIKIVQEIPVQMSDELFWFQCFDPAGNIVEFLGGK